MQWGADPASVLGGVGAPHSQFRRIVVHHTVVPYGGDPRAYMRRMQAARPDLGLEVPYSFVVMPGATDNDAVIGVGRGWGRTGAHTIGYNDTAYGVAFAGDYTDVAPTAAMFAAVRLIGSYMDAPEETLGHRDTYATACPGAATYPLLGELQPPFQSQSILDDTPEDTDVQLSDTTTAGHSVNDILNWSIDGINRLEAAVASLTAVVAAIQAGSSSPIASGAPSADAIIDKLKERL